MNCFGIGLEEPPPHSLQKKQETITVAIASPPQGSNRVSLNTNYKLCVWVSFCPLFYVGRREKKKNDVMVIENGDLLISVLLNYLLIEVK